MSRRRIPFAALTAAAAAVLMVGGIAACSSGGGTSASGSNSPIVVCGDFALAGPYDEVKELADTFDIMLARLDKSFDGHDVPLRG